ncbi:MAG: transcription antitermination factor NusB [Planctomycetota bacterium]
MTSARGEALRALVALERGRAERLRDALTTHSLAPRDQAFAFELAHGVLRRQRLLDHVLAGLAHRGLPEDLQLLVPLRLGAYQLLFLPGMAPHAAVNETVGLVRGNRGFANAILRAIGKAIVDRPAMASPRELALGPERTLVLANELPADPAARLAIEHSLPDFLVERWREQLGDEGMTQAAVASSATPAVWLRTALGTDPAAVRAQLAVAGVATEPGEHPRMLRWSGGSSPFASEAFRAGAFVVQDPTAFAAAEAVPCGAGDTVVDLCAAPGTKTTALAERVRPGGRVIAFDIDPARRQRIAENVARLRLGDTVTIAPDPAALPVADAVLADVPCSNTGVLARRVEVRRRLQPSTFRELAAVQRTLLRQAIGLCRPGGAIVYSTCSIDREENDDVVAAVLADPATPRCRRGQSRLALPRAGACDGGWFAVLHREA